MKPEVRSVLEQCLIADESDWRGTLEEACRLHPDLADELRLAFEEVSILHRNLSKVKSSGIPARLGEFRILRKLGEGGMGIVFLAEQESLGRKVAIKMIRPNISWTSQVEDRFRREAEAVSRLQHPGIVPIYSVGVEDGMPYLVMEWIPGCTLADVLAALRERKAAELQGSDMELVVRRRAREAGAALPQLASQATFHGSWQTICARLFKQVAEALEHVHARGILHRDVKPSNILITPTGRAMLLDFGLALIDDAQSRVTKSGAFLGTSAYASPEQLREASAEVDERSDLFSLGASLYESLTFQTPAGETRSDPRVRLSNPSVSWELDSICRSLLAEDAELRYRSAGDLARDLGNALEGLPLERRHANSWRRSWLWIKKNPGWAAAYALVFLGFAGFSLREMKAREQAERLRADADSRRKEADAQKELALTKSAALEKALEALAREQAVVRAREEDAREGSLAARDALAIWGEILNRLAPTGNQKPATRAEAFETLSQDIDRRFGADTRSQGMCYYSVGVAFMSLQEWKHSETALRRALGIQEKTLGAVHLETAMTQRALFYPLAKLNRKEEGKAFLRQAAKTLRQILGENHRETEIIQATLSAL